MPERTFPWFNDYSPEELVDILEPLLDSCVTRHDMYEGWLEDMRERRTKLDTTDTQGKKRDSTLLERIQWYTLQQDAIRQALSAAGFTETGERK